MYRLPNMLVSILSKISLKAWTLIYVLSIFSTYILDRQIRENAGVSLVSDEGIYLAYSHMLSGTQLSDLEQQHISGYGKYYWLRCLPLVFPASLFNRIGIEGVLSLRLTIWIFGYIGFYLFFKSSQRNRSGKNGLAAMYFFLFAVCHMVRFFGIKETIISTSLLIFCIMLDKYYSKNLRTVSIIKHTGSRYILLTASAFLFLQSYYVLIFAVTFAVFSVLHRSIYSAGISLILFVMYILFNFLTTLLGPNSDIKLEIVPTQRIVQNEASSGGSFIPKSVIAQVPFLLDAKLENLTESKNAVSVENEVKYLHLFYVNFSEPLSALVSLESLAWLVLLVLLTSRYLKFRNLEPSSQLILLMLSLAFTGILLYDENFGTYLRHRDQILISVLFFVSQSYKKQRT